MGQPVAALKGKVARLLGLRPPARRLDPAALPEGAAAWLRPDHPTLLALEARYAAMDQAVTAPAIWTPGRISDEDLLYFRADNDFVWQLREANRTARRYAMVARHLRGAGLGPLLDRLGEDAAFGAALFKVDGRAVSRDLLDSAGEIHFLQRHAGLGARPLNIIDIGAGYGRLTWRMEQATGAETRIFATDGVARSTFIAGHYLAHRGARRASAVPLDEVEALLAGTRIDLAVNVHSFPECRPEAVAWWIERLARHEVPRLMIVPNAGTSAGARCQFNDGAEMEPLLARFGYRPIVREPRYADPVVQARGIDPVHLHLFARDG